MNLVQPRIRPPSASRGDELRLERLRRGIDTVDDRILALLNERALLARDVARVKAVESLPIYNPEREREVMDRLAARATSFPSESVFAVYREVIRACRAVQEPLVPSREPAVRAARCSSHVRGLSG
jgi:chorismate mutase/prephenate dehydratase